LMALVISLFYTRVRYILKSRTEESHIR
jgi:hypothetical protein